MITRFVDTASSGGDGTTENLSGADAAYAGLGAAIADLESEGGPAALGDAVTIRCKGTAADTDGGGTLDQFDVPTTATFYLQIEGYSPLNGKRDDSKWRLTVTNRNGIYNNVTKHLRLTNLQVGVTTTSGSYVGIKTANANLTGSDIDQRCWNCVVWAAESGGGSVICYENRPLGASAEGTSKFWNNVAYKANIAYSCDFKTATHLGEYYNNTAVKCNFCFIDNDAAGSMLMKNNGGVINAGAGPAFVNSGAWAAGCTDNASSDGSGPPTNLVTGTPLFADYSNDDFHLHDADTVWKNAGISDPGSGLFSDDCDGQTRSTWDIGADEAIAPTCALSGTATAAITEGDVVTGGKTVILTLSAGRFVAVNQLPEFVVGTGKGTTAGDGRDGNGAITINWPSGYSPLAGDFAVILLYSDAGSGSVPTDFSEVSGSPFGSGTPKLQIFHKSLAGGESAPSTTISGSASLNSHVANMAIYRGSGAIGAVGTASDGTGTPMTAGAVTTTDDNSIVLFCCGRGDNENSSGQTFGGSSTGVAERLDAGTSAGNDSQVSMADKFFATSGTSSGSGSATTSATDPWVAVQIELKRATPFASARAAMASGLDSAQSEAAGWDAKVKPNIPVANVVRTSETVCTITLQAQADYNITAQETITATLPASIVAGGFSGVVASPTFTIDAAGAAGGLLVRPWPMLPLLVR